MDHQKVLAKMVFLPLLLVSTAMALQDNSEIVKTSLELTNGEENLSSGVSSYSTEIPTTRTQYTDQSPQQQQQQEIIPSYNSGNNVLIDSAAAVGGLRSFERKPIPGATPQQVAVQLLPKNVNTIVPREKDISSPSANIVPIVKEANSQYQYQINSRYEEKSRPDYPERYYNQYLRQPSSISFGRPSGVLLEAAAPTYQLKDDAQIQVQGKTQRRTETNLISSNNPEIGTSSIRGLSNQQLYSEYGNGEASPDYNTYLYKRIYY